ncbi:MAG TPA: zf-HC2 domain-containing protein [Thermoanaerobaculia bacterium]|nr:zf-HC2 domain-containing protein [Thermoanaerobaculia bacterium]
MSELHPDREALQRFLSDALSEPESRALQRHLLACPPCEERLIRLLPREGGETAAPGAPSGPPPAPPEAGYQRLVRRVLAETGLEIERRWSLLAAERVSAEELWRELRLESRERRHALVLGDPRFQSWGLFELLIGKSDHAVLVEPQKALEILRLALDLTGHLGATSHGPGAVDAAKARAWACLGNALRILSDFRQSEQAFQTAEAHLAKSWLDPMDEALVLELKASLRRAQRRFGEALVMLEAAIGLYREINEPHLQGRALLKKGLVLQYGHRFEEACACFRSSLFLLDGTEDPRLVAVGQFNLINCLHDAGRTAEAAALLPEGRQMMRVSGTRSDLVRLRWLEGKIAAVLGPPAEAERALLEARDALVEDAAAFDAALVSLDLAGLYAREGRAAETKRLIQEILPIFRSCEVHGEALAALIVFQQAAEMEQLSLGLVEEIASFLQQAKSNPGLRFRDGGEGLEAGDGAAFE